MSSGSSVTYVKKSNQPSLFTSPNLAPSYLMENLNPNALVWLVMFRPIPLWYRNALLVASYSAKCLAEGSKNFHFLFKTGDNKSNGTHPLL